MTGSTTIIARSEEPVRANAEDRAFSTNTNVHGITTYALLVSITLREYRAKKAATADLREERPCAAAALDAELTSSRRSSTGDAIPLPLRDLYASTTTTSTQMAKRQLMSANVGNSRTRGWEQEPGHVPQYSDFDDARCVKDATWKSLTRVCCREDSDVQ